MHHAYIVLGNPEKVWGKLEGELDFKRVANPDALSLVYDTFGIDEARNISDWAIKRPFGERKVAVVSMNSFTGEAQNALLKIFEEPPENTHFFFVVPSVGIVLPTLLSRVQVMNLEIAERSPKTSLKFIESSIPERLKLVSKIVKDKNKEEAKSFVRALLLEAYESGARSEILEKLVVAEKYLGSRSSSIKMILEYIAVMV